MVQPGRNKRNMTSAEHSSKFPRTSENGNPETTNETSEPGTSSTIRRRGEWTNSITEPLTMFNCVVDGHGVEVTCADINEENTMFACGLRMGIIKVRGLDLKLNATKVVPFDRSEHRGSFLNDPECYECVEEPGTRINHYFRGHQGRVNGLAFTPSKLLMSCSNDGTAQIWKVSSAIQHVHTYNHDIAVNSVAASSDGVYFATASMDWSVNIWNCERNAPIRILDHEADVKIVKFEPKNRFVTTVSHNQVTLWSLKDGKPIWNIPRSSFPVSSIAFSPEGKYMICGDDNGYIKLWDLFARRMLSENAAHSNKVLSVTYNTDRSLIASAGGEGFIKIWHAERFLYDQQVPSLIRAAHYRPGMFCPMHVKFYGCSELVAINDSRFITKSRVRKPIL